MEGVEHFTRRMSGAEVNVAIGLTRLGFPVEYLKMPGVADNEWKTVYLRVKVAKGAVCTFAYSLDGKKYTAAGEPFTARQGKWIGAKVGLFCVTPNDGNRGWADVDWFRVTK